MRRARGLTLVEVHRQKLHRQEPAPLELVERGEQRVAVLAPRQADQPARAAFDHAVLLDRLAHLAHDPLAELLELRRFGRTVKQRVNIIGVIKHLIWIQPQVWPDKRERKNCIQSPSGTVSIA